MLGEFCTSIITSILCSEFAILIYLYCSMMLSVFCPCYPVFVLAILILYFNHNLCSLICN